MEIALVPSFENPIQLHAIYGINCYQNAIGYKPITIHFNHQTGRLSYLTLCPGHFSEKFHMASGNNPSYQISAQEMKRLIIEHVNEDGLEELEARSVSDAINIPDGKKLIAMFYSNERKDFDFQVYDKKTSKWKNKTPMEDYSERDDLPRFLAGGYVFCRFFVCPEDVNPKGAPKGRVYTYQSQDITLCIPEKLMPWERGPVLQRVDGGFQLSKNAKIYMPPDLSFSA